MRHLGDITKISGYTAPIVDCIIGGSPCQDLSVAGKRAGLDGERSGLFMEQVRIVKEMRERDERNGRSGIDVRCRYLIWENVPGALSSGKPKGEDFRIVLEELAKVKDKNAVIPRPADGKWRTSGCIVGRGYSIAWRVLDAQFFGTPDKPLPQRRRRIALVADFGGHSAPEILFVRQSMSGDTDEGEQKRKAVTCDASGGIGADDSYGVYCFEPGAAKRLGGYVWEGLAPTLRTEVGDNRPSVVYAVDQGGGKSQANVQEDISPTLTCTHGGEPAVVYNGENITHPLNKTTPLPGDPCHTLGTDSRNYLVQRTLSSSHYIVRRLTPLECERLQGYPDGWTDIGEWTDSKGKTKQASDAARYKALGNSIALPPWKWVLKRLCACYERDATMASLFDGIGGFPYLWEQLNGKGSCLWASEIEDFPIAVTKNRIGD